MRRPGRMRGLRPALAPGRPAACGRAGGVALALLAAERALIPLQTDPRAISSAGRAPPRQGGGHWFEPSIAHEAKKPAPAGFLLVWTTSSLALRLCLAHTWRTSHLLTGAADRLGGRCPRLVFEFAHHAGVVLCEGGNRVPGLLGHVGQRPSLPQQQRDERSTKPVGAHVPGHSCSLGRGLVDPPPPVLPVVQLPLLATLTREDERLATWTPLRESPFRQVLRERR